MSFNDIYNQEQQKAVLRRAMETGRVAHAYLFHGMEGVGKKTTARVFAKALNCRDDGIDACDNCPSCLKIDHGTHPDVITVAPKGAFIKIEDIRNLHSQSQFRPFEGKTRVFIVENADRMNEPSANALLKTLEEPTRSNMLILITSRPELLPITIRSRCQKLRFRPLHKETIAGYLREKRLLDGGAADVIAASARGSIGKADEMTDAEYLAFKNDVIEKIARWDGSRDPLAFLAFADELGGGGKKVLSERLEILKSWYRDMLVFKETGETAALIHQDILSTTKSYARKLAGRDILKGISVIDQTGYALDRNANKQLTLETMMFKLLGMTVGGHRTAP
jgi:DNA polymerase-3 subunit delta'